MIITPMKPSAHAPPSAVEADTFIRKVKSVDEFTDEYQPISYTIDGMLPSSSIYGTTGKRGSAKTSFLTGVSLAVLTGKKDILDLEVERGRVGYIILENPTDFRMKLATTLYVHSVNPKDLSKQFVILDMKLPHNEIIDQLTRDADENGPLQLVCYDTYQAGRSVQ
jgi:AAA domain